MTEVVPPFFQKTLYPASAEEVATIVANAAAEGVNLIPCGNGSKVNVYTGNAACPSVGVSLQKMNRIIEINPVNLSVTVEAGITLAELQVELGKKNISLPVVIISADKRTLGGLIAENTGNYEKYSHKNIGDYIIGLEFVTPTGELIRSGGKTVKNVAGYDFTRFLNGSLGTLGIITRVTFKLKPRPQERKTVLLAVPGLFEACALEEEIRQATMTVTACHAFSITDIFNPGFFPNAKIVVAVSVEGYESAVHEHTAKLAAIASNRGYATIVLDSGDYWQAYDNRLQSLGTQHVIAGRVNKRVLSGFIRLIARHEQSFSAVFFDLGSSDYTVHCLDSEVEKTTRTDLAAFFAENGFPALRGKKPPHPIYLLLKSNLDKKNCLFAGNLAFTPTEKRL
jgi:FAD/FMN-containing dehydrogenase